jgi:hypothetical protein
MSVQEVLYATALNGNAVADAGHRLKFVEAFFWGLRDRSANTV